MARTGGTNTTDKLTYASLTPTTTVSYAVWAYRTGAGNTTNGMMLSWSGDQIQNVTGVYSFIADSGAAARWAVTSGTPATNEWHHVCVTYDGGSTSNDPIIYIDGTVATISEEIAPLATHDLTAGPFYTHNRPTDNRAWQGDLAEIAAWTRILTVGEVVALSKGAAPSFFPQGLVFYAPLINDANAAYGGGTPTISGTSVAVHPRIFYPSQALRIAAAYGTQATATYTGSITPTGALIRNPAIVRSGSITPTGAFGARSIVKVAFTGTITPAAALIKSIGKSAFTGSITPEGALLRRYVAPAYTGTIGLAGALVKSIAKSAFTGSITPAGAFLKNPNKVAAGSITPTGALGSFSISKILTGVITPTSALVKAVTSTFAGVLAPIGNVIKHIIKTAFGGSITPSGTQSGSFPAPAKRVTSIDVAQRTTLAEVIGRTTLLEVAHRTTLIDVTGRTTIADVEQRNIRAEPE